MTAGDGRGRAAGAELEGDQPQLGKRPPAQLGVALRQPAVGEPVESVTAHAPVPGHGIQGAGRRHAGVEGGVEDRHLGLTGQSGQSFANAGHGGRVVERRQLREGVQVGQHPLIDRHRVDETIAPVHDTVPDRLQAIQQASLPEIGH